MGAISARRPCKNIRVTRGKVRSQSDKRCSGYFLTQLVETRLAPEELEKHCEADGLCRFCWPKVLTRRAAASTGLSWTQLLRQRSGDLKVRNPARI